MKRFALPWIFSSLCALAACGAPVNVGPVSYTLMVTQSPNATLSAGAGLGPVSLEIHDPNGKLADVASDVTVALLAASPNSTATLAGTTALAAAGGKVAFADLNIQTAGAYSLGFNANQIAATATSAGFVVSAGAAAALTFITQPATALPNTVLSPGIAVQFSDSFGNLVTDGKSPVALAMGNNPSNMAALTGVVSVPSNNGIATFTQAVVSATVSGFNDGFTLRATAAPNLTADSNAFAIIASSWQLQFGPGDPNIFALASLPPASGPGGILVWGGNPNTWQSTDGGSNWTGKPLGGPFNAFQIGAAPLGGGTTLYARGPAADSNIYMSVDNGSTFPVLSSGFTLLAADPNASGSVFANSVGGLYNVTRATATRILSTQPRLLTAGPGAPSTLYAYSIDGMLVSGDGGSTWTLRALPVADAAYKVLAADPKNLGTVYAATSLGLFKSTNAAATWTPLRTDCVGSLVVTPTAPTATPNQPTLYITAGASCNQPTSLYSSNDGGMTWADATWGLGLPLNGLIIVPDATVDGTVYAASPGLPQVFWYSLVGGVAASAAH